MHIYKKGKVCGGLQAMQRMREYERKLANEGKEEGGASPQMRTSPRKVLATAPPAREDMDSVVSSSAQDNYSESSMSDFPVCLFINSQLLQLYGW